MKKRTLENKDHEMNIFGFTITVKELEAAIQLINLSTKIPNAVPISPPHHHRHLFFNHDKQQQQQQQENNNNEGDALKTSHRVVKLEEEEEEANRHVKKKLRHIVDIYSTTRPYTDINIIIPRINNVPGQISFSL